MKRIFHLLFLIIFLSTLNLLADTIVRPIKPIPIPHPLIVIDPLLTQPQYDFIALAEKDAMWLSLSKPTIDDMGEGLKFGPNTNASKGVVRYNNVVGSDGKPYHNALYVQPNITAKTGAVVARYAMRVPDDAGKFIALVGLTKDAIQSDGVVFHFGYLEKNSRKPIDLVSKRITPADGLQRIEARVDQFKNTAIVFYLKVDVYNDPLNDFVFFTAAGIYNAKACAVGADIVPTNYSITWLPGSYTYYDSWLTLSILMKILNNSGDKIINTMRNRARYYDWQNNLINETFNVYKTGFAPNEAVTLDFRLDGNEYRTIRTCKVVIDLNIPFEGQPKPYLWERDYDNNHVEVFIRKCDASDALSDIHAVIRSFVPYPNGVYLLDVNAQPAWHVLVAENSIDSELWGEDVNGAKRLIRNYTFIKTGGFFRWEVAFNLVAAEVKGIKKFIFIMDPQNKIKERREDNNTAVFVVDQPL